MNLVRPFVNGETHMRHSLPGRLEWSGRFLRSYVRSQNHRRPMMLTTRASRPVQAAPCVSRLDWCHYHQHLVTAPGYATHSTRSCTLCAISTELFDRASTLKIQA